MRMSLFAVLAAAAIILGSCAAAGELSGGGTAFTDAMGYSVSVGSADTVVSLYGSFAETWLLAGGTLAGVTEDAKTERGLDLPDAAVVGAVKTPNLEEILALSPDFVILSADIEADAALHSALAGAGIAHAYFRVDTFDDYLAMLRLFCDITGRDDLYDENGEAVGARIDQWLAAAEGAAADKPPTALLLRAYSTGAKAKGTDIFAGAILADLGVKNILDDYPSLLDDLSMEEIIAVDPDYIFVVPMGADEESAKRYLSQNFESNPAWAGLSAVKNGKYIFLPKELFHYKPNARWDESYAYLAKLLYPELAEKLG